MRSEMKRDACGIIKSLFIRNRERNVENSDRFIILTRLLAFRKKKYWKNYKENAVIHAVICEVIPQIVFSPWLVLLVGVGTLNSASLAFHVVNVTVGFWWTPNITPDAPSKHEPCWQALTMCEYACAAGPGRMVKTEGEWSNTKRSKSERETLVWKKNWPPVGSQALDQVPCERPQGQDRR